jgi:hypothetical protein
MELLIFQAALMTVLNFSLVASSTVADVSKADSNSEERYYRGIKSYSYPSRPDFETKKKNVLGEFYWVLGMSLD